ncbi:YdcF family protein [Enterovirga sp.]|uniref:YdcF family protein n=1 Tax=Enterovirga sp. TaxID=2026350 RepID=UPI002B6D121C|nr:YdcF family protein [Enterovirga sp.]HMO28397.1 YdcF family protein [Enterovirga sp.]
MNSGHELQCSPAGQEGSSSGRRRRVGVVLATAAAAACMLFLFGFGAFLLSLDRKERDPAVVADAIVALTGGQGRVEDALELLAKGYGQRLLITGVNERTSLEAIKRLSPTLRDLVECCVDLDYRARNTVGNAAEISRWAQARGFRSLIVVTSNYHLPRTLAELDEALPSVVKIPYAVIASRSGEDWETRLARGRVILSEYVKFLAVSVRTRLAGWFVSGWESARMRRDGAAVAERRRAG